MHPPLKLVDDTHDTQIRKTGLIITKRELFASFSWWSHTYQDLGQISATLMNKSFMVFIHSTNTKYITYIILKKV